MPAWTLNERATVFRLFNHYGYVKDNVDWEPIYRADTDDIERSTLVISEEYQHRKKNGKSKMYERQIEKSIAKYTAEELAAYNFARDGIKREAKRMGITLPAVNGLDHQVAQANQVSLQHGEGPRAVPSKASRRRFDTLTPEDIGDNIVVAQRPFRPIQDIATDNVASSRVPVKKHGKNFKGAPTTKDAPKTKGAQTNTSPQQVTTGTAAPPHVFMTQRRECTFSIGSDLSSFDSDHEAQIPIPKKSGPTRPAVQGNVAQGARTKGMASQQVYTIWGRSDEELQTVVISKRKKRGTIQLESESEHEGAKERKDVRHSTQQERKNAAAPSSTKLPDNKKLKIVDYKEYGSPQQASVPIPAPGLQVPGRSFAPLISKAERKRRKALAEASKAQDNAKGGRVQKPKGPATENLAQRMIVPGEGGVAISIVQPKSKVKAAENPVVQGPEREDEVMVDAGQEAQHLGGPANEIMDEAGDEAIVKAVLKFAANASADAFESMGNGMSELKTSKAKIESKEAGSAEVVVTGKRSVTDYASRTSEAVSEPAVHEKSDINSSSLRAIKSKGNKIGANGDWRRVNLDRILLEPFHDPFVQESKSSKKSSSREQMPVKPLPRPIAPKERVLNFFNDMFDGGFSKEYISSVIDPNQQGPYIPVASVFGTLKEEACKQSIKCKYVLSRVFKSPESPFSNFRLADGVFGHGLQMLHTSDVKFFSYSPSTPIACAKVRGSYHIAPEEIKFIDHDDLVFKRGGRVYKLHILQEDCAILGADNNANTAYVSMDVMLCQAFDCPKCSNVEDHGDPRVSISSIPRVHMRNLSGDDNEFVSPVIPLWRKHEHEKDEEEKFLVDLSYGTTNVKFWDGKRQPVALCHRAECEGCLEAASVRGV
jgi:hypothetical protein